MLTVQPLMQIHIGQCEFDRCLVGRNGLSIGSVDANSPDFQFIITQTMEFGEVTDVQ